MRKNFTIESRRNFRFSLYSRDEPIGLGETYSSVIRRSVLNRIRNKNKIQVMSI